MSVRNNGVSGGMGVVSRTIAIGGVVTAFKRSECVHRECPSPKDCASQGRCQHAGQPEKAA